MDDNKGYPRELLSLAWIQAIFKSMCLSMKFESINSLKETLHYRNAIGNRHVYGVIG